MFPINFDNANFDKKLILCPCSINEWKYTKLEFVKNSYENFDFYNDEIITTFVVINSSHRVYKSYSIAYVLNVITCTLKSFSAQNLGQVNLIKTKIEFIY